jgi:hypothetical protein
MAFVPEDRLIVARYEVPLPFGHFQSVARSGQNSLAQGLPWVVLPTRIALKGPQDTAINGSETFEPDRVRVSGPFRAKRYFRLTQGKP